MIDATAAQRAVSALFASLAPYAQHARLVTLGLGMDGASIPDATSLIVERVRGDEAVNAPFRFEIECLSTSVELELKSFLGEPIKLGLLKADGAHRHWHGHVTEAAWLGADGGLVRYRLTMSPWTTYLELRRDSFIFVGKTAEEIVTELFADHPSAAFRFDLSDAPATRPICTQYRESDWHFVTRLLAEEGWSYRFEHAPDGASHTLVIFDKLATLPNGMEPVIRFHRSDASEAADSITTLAESCRIAPGSATLAGWHAPQLLAPAASETTPDPFPNAPALESFDGSRAQRFADANQAQRAASNQAAAFAFAQRSIEGSGSARALAAGTGITLSEHAALPDAQLAVVSVHHEAANNLGAGIASLIDRKDADSEAESGSYRNRFEAVAIGTPMLVPYVPRPTANGLQTALVVGLSDATLTSDRDHRVRVQFAWQRGHAPNAGGLTELGTNENASADTKGHAPGDDSSGTWVRVAEAAAGPNWGSSFTPRIGTEVLIEFVEGDIDHPLIVAALYNGADTPPFAAGVDGDVGHPGWLSGLHVPTVSGAGAVTGAAPSDTSSSAGFGQWVMDDATGQVRTRLLASVGASQLSLGSLIDHAASNAGGALRGTARGTGIELTSTAWGAVRARDGMLVSTTLQSQARAMTLDALAASANLEAAANVAKLLSESATHQHAAALLADSPLSKLAELVATPQKASPKDARPLPETIAAAARFARPVLVVETPAQLAATTPASMLAMAGASWHHVAGEDVHWAAAATIATVSGAGTSLYAWQGGATLVAAAGPVYAGAHADTLEVLADKSVTVTSTGASIDVAASTKIVLVAAGAMVTLEGGNITFACPGLFSVKGAMHGWPGAQSNPAVLPLMPRGTTKAPDPNRFDQRFVLRWANSGKPVKNTRFTILREDGSKVSATTDTEGHSPVLDTTSKAERLAVEVARADLH